MKQPKLDRGPVGLEGAACVETRGGYAAVRSSREKVSRAWEHRIFVDFSSYEGCPSLRDLGRGLARLMNPTDEAPKKPTSYLFREVERAPNGKFRVVIRKFGDVDPAGVERDVNRAIKRMLSKNKGLSQITFAISSCEVQHSSRTQTLDRFERVS